MGQEARWAAAIVGAMMTPFALMSAYFAAAGPGEVRYASLDLPAMVLAVLAGSVFLGMLRIGKPWQLGLTLAYIPVMGFLAFWYSLWFVCVLFNDCL